MCYHTGGDAWRWNIGPEVFYSLDSARAHIDQMTLPGIGVAVRWNKSVPRKVNIMVWRLQLNRLPLRVNLDARGIDLESIMCPVCDSEQEDARHLFFRCEVARQLWRRIGMWIDQDISAVFDWEMLWDWIDGQPVRRIQRRVIDVVCRTSMWVLWRFRNAKVFDDQSLSQSMLFDLVVFWSFHLLSVGLVVGLKTGMSG